MRAGMLRERPAVKLRRWAVPPGAGSPRGPFEGWGVLAEVDGADGVALWQALRDAELWAGATPERRISLWQPELAPASVAAGDWAGELHALAEARAGGPAERARACVDVARTAASRGCPRTAVSFAEVAARIVPTDAAAALEAGRILRQVGDARRAEAWLRRAMALARRGQDHASYGLACCAWAGLLKDRGELAAAAERYHRAARVARRFGLWRVKPIACWGLCALAAAEGRAEDATLHGRRAMRALGRRDPRLPLLAHDLAIAWSAGGHVAAAQRVLRPAAERLRGSDRASVLATLGRIASLPRCAATPRSIDALSADLAETLALREDDL